MLLINVKPNFFRLSLECTRWQILKNKTPTCTYMYCRKTDFCLFRQSDTFLGFTFTDLSPAAMFQPISSATSQFSNQSKYETWPNGLFWAGRTSLASWHRRVGASCRIPQQREKPDKSNHTWMITFFALGKHLHVDTFESISLSDDVVAFRQSRLRKQKFTKHNELR